MSQHFTHLHLHTEYSLLDGAIGLDRLIGFAQQHSFKALAMTDHGNIFGAVKFFQKCKKAGIKPILGMEAYLTPDAKIKNVDNKYHHLILLVQNAQGYKNLCKLISFSYQEGFYFKPRIDYEQLAKYSEGLIVTSACLGGHIPSLLMANNEIEVHNRIDWFLDVFGKERFYLEVQPEDQKEQKILNQKLYELSAARGIDLVAAGDCHYLTPQDHEAHEIMLAIQTHDNMNNPDRYTFGDCRVHMRTQDQMLELFKEHESAIWNSGKIADMCEFAFETGKLFFPQFAIPQEHTPETYFKQLCQEGLDRLFAQEIIPATQREQYQTRLDLEADLIIKMGFVGYFLVVSDFIQWAYRTGIPVGPGRGSAAGSLVAWSLQITNIDPIKYNLLFERFLNPERISMPDIDIDFCIEGRERVIDYVRTKYGHDKVCYIITFGTMLAKGVIKDVARALGFSFEDSNAITSLIPEQLKITLKEAIEQEPRLKELVENNPKATKLFDIAFRLEGLTRHASKHAAGIVISPDPIDEVLPVYVPPKTTDLVAQYAMTELEAIGFLKIDLLGLKNLTLIDRVIRLIHKNHHILLDMNKLSLDDPKTFALVCAGHTSGVFQLESSGIKEVLRKLQPDKFEDIIAVNALYRPGPLGSGMVDDYIERRHGRQQISYLFPELEPVLAETYGVIVYQEQVIKIASVIGGYSLGEADILRRAMGKKKADEMAKQREIFMTRSVAQGFNEKKAAELFDLMAYFAGYGFNKSHSAAYALIAYQTAYLKANYPAEFMACLISLEATDAEKMAFYLQEAKDMHINLVPPSINRSEINFSVHQGAILFGLLGVKNVGLAALENIIAEREQHGPFSDLFDFCKRIDLRTSNKRVLEQLICAGALDEFPGNRAQKFNELHTTIERAIAIKKDLATGQMGLFGGAALSPTQHASDEGHIFEQCKEWSDKEKLEKEKDAVGFYLSAHPLEAYKKIVAMFQPLSFEEALQKATKKSHSRNGRALLRPTEITKAIITKKGERMAFVSFEDAQSTAEVIVFPKLYSSIEPWLGEYQVFLIKGTLDPVSPTTCKIKASELVPLELVLHAWSSIEHVMCELPATSPTHQTMQQIKEVCNTTGSTGLSFVFHENDKKLLLTTKTSIMISNEWVRNIEPLIEHIRFIL